MSSITPLLADVVWPALFLEQRLFSWWAIGAGLLAELLFVRYITKLSWSMCIVADIAMNAASSILGFILIPLAGIVWEFFPGLIFCEIFHIGTFNPITWTATFVIAAMVNGSLEGLVLRFGFKQAIGKKGFWLLCLANAVSIGMAFYSVFAHPPQS
ncbi:MAG: hypothetical protein ACFUZC_23735 [Chthoniobacteraceae bacterium]